MLQSCAIICTSYVCWIASKPNYIMNHQPWSARQLGQVKKKVFVELPAGFTAVAGETRNSGSGDSIMFALGANTPSSSNCIPARKTMFISILVSLDNLHWPSEIFLKILLSEVFKLQHRSMRLRRGPSIGDEGFVVYLDDNWVYRGNSGVCPQSLAVDGELAPTLHHANGTCPPIALLWAQNNLHSHLEVGQCSSSYCLYRFEQHKLLGIFHGLCLGFCCWTG